jgi:hypothetical protein
LLWASCYFFFEGGILPINFGIALRGTGNHAKTVACLLETAIGGAAIFSFARYAAQVARGEPYSYSVVVVVFSAGTIFPLYLNLFSVAKKQVDPF